jgi:hypothetical protein
MARTPARLPNGTRISDHVTLGVLTTTVPAGLIDAVLADTGRQSRRQRQLPARLVVYYVMALALYAQASYGEVLRCLLEGVRWLHRRGAALALADKSAITKARTRLGPAPLKQLFARVARPLAEPGTQGAWYRGRRLVSLDGTTIDLPDTPDLEAHFGRPGAARGSSGFPQLRLLTLTETGTHAIFAFAFDRYQTSEVALAPELLRRLEPGMLCLADRAFVGFALWRRATATGADLLWRVRKNQVLPCCGSLPDGSYLSRLHASPKHRRHDQDGIGIRVIDYRLADVPGAEPLYRLVHPARSGCRTGQGAGRALSRAVGERGHLRRVEGQPARSAPDAAQPPGGSGRAGALRPAPGALRPAPADPRRQPAGGLRPRCSVLPPHGAHRPPALAVSCRVFPLAGGTACLSWC